MYVNYGLPGDYDILKAAGVEVKGAIVLARYGRVHRAVKVFNAEQRGARGIMIYSDPADDGAGKGGVWPAGPWRHPQFIQRGNAKYSWFYHGDPLTPGSACPVGAVCKTLDPQTAPTLPKIPGVAISAAAAAPIFRRLSNAQLQPTEFHGAPPFPYHVRGSGAEVELDVEMDNGPRPIYNVVARIEGAAQKDQWVILGTHHDAWTYGGVDPGSAGATLLELARVLAAMKKNGWQPQRTLVFAFWDAEEYGLIGSTEFAERHAEELREKAVAYINSDLYMAGGLRAGGTASLRDFVAEVARDVAAPSGEGSVYSQWRRAAASKPAAQQKDFGAFEPELEVLGSGADFVPFQAHLGLPALSLEFGGESYGSYGVYHSNYDTRWFMEKFGDPGWRYGPALVEVLGRAATRLASADALPYRYSHLADLLSHYLRGAERANADAQGKPRMAQPGFENLQKQVAEFRQAALTAERALDAALARGAVDTERLVKVNRHLARVESSFAVSGQAETNPPRWYRHTIYGWNIYALYAGQTLPALHRAIETGDATAFNAERACLERALSAATGELKLAVAALSRQ